METRTIAATTHGRYLYEKRDERRLLIGFHGYAENAEIHMRQLKLLPGAEEWSLVAVQALHRFYTRGDTDIAASWMTYQDREFAIADNIAYVQSIIREVGAARLVVFAGFSQGVAMAYRAAARAHPAAGIIALGGDVPPDVEEDTTVKLPPVLVGRGERDTWYTDFKLKKDLKFLEVATKVTSLVFDGGHEWTDDFRKAAGKFLQSLANRD